MMNCSPVSSPSARRRILLTNCLTGYFFVTSRGFGIVILEIEKVLQKTFFFALLVVLLVLVTPVVGIRRPLFFVLLRGSLHAVIRSFITAAAAGDQFIKLSAVQPHAAASRTIIDLNSLPLGHGQCCLVDRTLHIYNPLFVEFENIDRKSTRLNSSHGYISY